MGYSTTFTGTLKFKYQATGAQLAKLMKYLGEDARDHNWDGDFDSYVDLRITDDFDGVEWDGSEKSRLNATCINTILREMRKSFPNFGFTGELLAQGEEFSDRWKLVMDGDWAKDVETPIVGDKVTCPHCDEEFIIEK